MRKRNIYLCLILAAGVFLYGPGSSHADISFVPVTWDSGTEGWTSQNAVGTVANGGGNLNMNFAGLGSPAVQTDAMVADNLAGYNGNYGAYQYLQVSFNFQGYASSAQSLYFESAAGGGSTWAYDLSISDSGWHGYIISLSDSSGWTRLSGSESFAQALASVDLIGITVSHLNTGSPFDYNLDDWTYRNPVPEPGTLAMLFSALGSIGFVCRFRRKKKKIA